MTPIDIESVARITRGEAPSLAEEEYKRLASLAAQLSPDEWTRPTECPGWTVREVLAHVAGAMAGTSLREGARQRKEAGQRAQSSGGTFLDEMNELHIEDRAALSDSDVALELQERTGPAVKARRRVPGPLRRTAIPGGADGFTLGELLDVVLTRDVWMHRIDVCRAVDRAPELTPEHDGRLVADVVREWADTHGQSFTLHLTGAAGGTFVRAGENDNQFDLDAVDFCRSLSGRETGAGLLAIQLVF